VHTQGPLEECWCCGARPTLHAGRGLCDACYSRWQRRGFTGPGPGPSLKPPAIESAREYAGVIMTMPARKAAGVIGVSERTVERYRRLLRG